MTLAERPIWCAARALRALAPLVRILHAATRGTQECEKYGAVKQCVIFEVTERSVAPEEAVRTFVAFEKQVPANPPPPLSHTMRAVPSNATLWCLPQESALKAFLDLEGRFFAGRKISCAFYDEARFLDRELDEPQ